MAKESKMTSIKNNNEEACPSLPLLPPKTGSKTSRSNSKIVFGELTAFVLHIYENVLFDTAACVHVCVCACSLFFFSLT